MKAPPEANAGRKPVEVFSTCPASLGAAGRSYLREVAAVARWSEVHGCRGILVYADNRLVDPWLLSQVVVQHTKALSPLVAVQPVYTHPYAVAKLVATFAGLYRRQLFLNWVAGGFKNDLTALGDGTAHDRRYDRLVEYAGLVRRLTSGETVTVQGDFYEVDKLSLVPGIDPELRPDFMVSGSSGPGRAAARALGARSVTYAMPRGEEQDVPLQPGLDAGLRVGIIAREDGPEAWRIAYERFPPDRTGALTRGLARKVSDSHWHARLCLLAEERASGGEPYWLGPFENYKSMCPYLVGSHEDVAREIARYLSHGFRTFILDQPGDEEDLAHTACVFQLARHRELLSVL